MAGEVPMETESRVMLTRIEGDVKRIFDKFEQYTKDSDRRDREHASFSENVNARLNGHSDRIRAVESAQLTTAGQAQGTAKTVKVAYAAGGVIMTIITALGAALARQLGI